MMFMAAIPENKSPPPLLMVILIHGLAHGLSTYFFSVSFSSFLNASKKSKIDSSVMSLKNRISFPITLGERTFSSNSSFSISRSSHFSSKSSFSYIILWFFYYNSLFLLLIFNMLRSNFYYNSLCYLYYSSLYVITSYFSYCKFSISVDIISLLVLRLFISFVISTFWSDNITFLSIKDIF